MRDIFGPLLFALAVKIMRPQTLREIIAKADLPSDRESQTIAGWAVCPDCGIEVPIGVAPLRFETNESGEQEAFLDLQTDDLWAHAWTHGTDQEPS